jgi:hypothetical protein
MFSVSFVLKYSYYKEDMSVFLTVYITTLFVFVQYSPRWGSLTNWDTKINSWVPWDSYPRKTPLAMPSNNWKLHTRPLVRKGAPHQQTRNSLKVTKKKKEEIGFESQMGVWHQDKLTNSPSFVIKLWLWLWAGCNCRLRIVRNYWKVLLSEIIGSVMELMQSSSSWVHCESRASVAGARGQFGNPE